MSSTSRCSAILALAGEVPTDYWLPCGGTESLRSPVSLTGHFDRSKLSPSGRRGRGIDRCPALPG
jgi:hypothetical protein